jgi:hypothetical protein
MGALPDAPTPETIVPVISYETITPETIYFPETRKHPKYHSGTIYAYFRRIISARMKQKTLTDNPFSAKNTASFNERCRCLPMIALSLSEWIPACRFQPAFRFSERQVFFGFN